MDKLFNEDGKYDYRSLSEQLSNLASEALPFTDLRELRREEPSVK